MRVIIEPDYQQLSRWAAEYVAAKINAAQPTEEHPFKLGCPTGSSPLGLYKHLIELHKAGKVSFRNVVTFNMDEYVGLPEEHPESYHSFMWKNFFSHIDIKKENVHILNGNAADLEAECAAYEKAIEEAGGIDLFMGGIGPDGHIAFNDPWVADFDDPALVKRVPLDPVCRQQQVHDGCFASFDLVPEKAITLTVPTLLRTSKLICAVPGSTKAKAAYDMLNGPIGVECPASSLRLHPDATLYLDADAAALLKA